jgi:hypothetical protein
VSALWTEGRLPAIRLSPRPEGQILLMSESAAKIKLFFLSFIA